MRRDISLFCSKYAIAFLSLVVFLLAVYLRMSGLFRGLFDSPCIFHPDEPKQVAALFDFLGNHYIHYYGSLFYDGYPYGLNHLDEYLLRVVFFFLGEKLPPEHFSLYYHGRALRVVYGMITVFLAYKIVASLTGDRKASLLALLLIAIAPLSITVSHFATGDIGVDLFVGLGLLCLVYHIKTPYKKLWLFASGVAVGAAFSAKYNGLLFVMVPGLVLCFGLLRDNDYKSFFKNCAVLGLGVLLGTVVFTPALLLDFNTTVSNIFKNFEFIKNYSTPQSVLSKPIFERAWLSLSKNFLYITSFFSYPLWIIPLIGTCLTTYRLMSARKTQYAKRSDVDILLLSVSIFLILSLFISIAGKYRVQPFHFSYLQLPLAVLAGCLYAAVRESTGFSLKGIILVLAGFAIFQYGKVSSTDNFFWKLEDNLFYQRNLAPSIFTAEALNAKKDKKAKKAKKDRKKRKDRKSRKDTKGQDSIRSLVIEPRGSAIFRNLMESAKGVDASFWNTIQVAPLPQVINPIGKDWIFVNGPTFPKNEKMFKVHGGKYGRTITRQLVVPADAAPPVIGIQSGSSTTAVSVAFGGAEQLEYMEAHQQKIISLKPEKWRKSIGGKDKNIEVRIISLEVSASQGDAWLTVLQTPLEENLFALFGGGQIAEPRVPEAFSTQLAEEYSSALSHLRYMENSEQVTVGAGQRTAFWSVTLPAGCYNMTLRVEGLADKSQIALELGDGGSPSYSQSRQVFSISKGVQEITYNFAKTFAPYQGRIVVDGIEGAVRISSASLFPDADQIQGDFETWRTTGTRPHWLSRFPQEKVY